MKIRSKGCAINKTASIRASCACSCGNRCGPKANCACFASSLGDDQAMWVPDTRRHRGPHPQDADLFSKEVHETLRQAVGDLSWLRTRGYAEPSALKLVGDRYQLRRRQRVAVSRCACPDQAMTERESRRMKPQALEGMVIELDGLNVLTTVEVALAGGVLLLGRDGCMRDMASFHGNYRLVRETERAVEVLLGVLDWMRPSEARIYIDRPVSNSGRLANTIRAAAKEHAVSVEVILYDRVDETLKASRGVVATADSAILDACSAWVNLARVAVEKLQPELDRFWLLDLA